MKKALVFMALLLGTGLLFGDDACRKVQDATTLFADPVVGKLKTIGHAFLGAAFLVEVAAGIYRMVFGRESWTVLGMAFGKYVLLFALFTYSGEALGYLSQFKAMGEAANTDDIGRFQKAMTEVDIAMWSLATGKPVEQTEEPKEGKEEEGFFASMGSITDVLSKVFSGHYLLILLTTLAIHAGTMLSLVMKILMIDIIWPILYQLALLGVVFAVPFAAMTGWGAIRNFAVTVIELALWPVFYWMCFNLTVGSLTCNLNEIVAWANEQASLADAGGGAIGAATYMATAAGSMLTLPAIPLVFAHLIFFFVLPMLVPTIAHLVVHHQGAAQVAQGLGGGVTGVLNNAVRRVR